MKTLCKTTMIVALLILCLDAVQAQPTQVKLNQIELMKQLLGTWKGEIARDTTMITEYLPFGNAMVGNDKVITKGRTINSLKELWGYDKMNDKLIGAELNESSLEVTSYAIWFTSENVFEAVLLQDISNPGKAILKYKMELKTADTFLETVIQNGKVISTMTFNREKN
jgi:hypothetical protein